MPVPVHRALTALASVATLTIAACSVGNDQRPVSDIPREFRSSAGGGLIEHVLILPMYEVMTGVSTKGGHGPGESTGRYVIAAPFRYRPGERFSVRFLTPVDWPFRQDSLRAAPRRFAA